MTIPKEHGAEVCRAEPHSRLRFQRLVRWLLALLVAGDEDGMTTTGHYGKTTTVSLPARVPSTTVSTGPYKGPYRSRSALGAKRPTTTGKKKSEPWPPPWAALPDSISTQSCAFLHCRGRNG
jgi:hypothetical protein